MLFMDSELATSNSESQNPSSSLHFRVLELYSGVGGMRYALEAAKIPFEIVAAVDMNPVVNKIYTHNFGTKGHQQRNLCSFTAEEIDGMKVDIITMSPPCQPFTRVGLKKDVEDTRSSSFLHILNILSQLQRKPSFIILENVKGFEISEARKILIKTLEECSYRYQEFLFSPHDVGVPNSRLRYYLTAKLESQPSSVPHICEMIPPSNCNWQSHCPKCLRIDCSPRPLCILKHFLEEKNSDYFEPYLVPDDVLLKYWRTFDIVDETSNGCCCFTRAYKYYVQGTGSFIAPIKDRAKVKYIFQQVVKTDDPNTKLELLKSLRLRYFTPKEIANILCFPESFAFPTSITLRQKYKSIGNSLNVFVVSCLIKSLVKDVLFFQ